jgi:hypothetical protein
MACQDGGMPRKAKIPERLQPRVIDIGEDPRVPTDLSVARTYSPDQINSLQHLGMIKIDGNRIGDIGKLGDASRDISMMRLIHGGALISIDHLSRVIGWAVQVVEGLPDAEGKAPSWKERHEAGKLVGYLADKLTKVGQGVSKVNHEHVQVAITVDEKRRRSFQPGMAISVNQPVKSPSKA